MGEFCKNIILQMNQSQEFINVNVSSLSLIGLCREIDMSESQGKYSEPMVTIGFYIVLASAICVTAMFFDLVYGVATRKFWFPSNCFSLNAASITMIAVAMKLPMDLSTPMPGEDDLVAKIGGLAFMCVMMSNFMPSLASMDNKSLLANVTGLLILVITLIVDVSLQMKTNLIYSEYPFMITTCISMGMLLFLLLILISCAITIPTAKKIMEFKYQTTSTAMSHLNPQGNRICTIDQLKQLVKGYWIMVETGNSQFVVASTPLSSASAIICAVIIVMHIYLLSQKRGKHLMDKSVYKHSTSLILEIQTAGIIIGSVAPIFRCFTALRFKSFASVFKVEKYWTKKLCEWKESPIRIFSPTYFRIHPTWVGFCRIRIYRYPSLSLSHREGIRRSSFLRNFRDPFLFVWIKLQKAVVVSCKIIDLIPIVVIMVVNICCSYCFKPLKAMLFTPPTASNEDLSDYVLVLEDDRRPTGYSVKNRLDLMNKRIKIFEKTEPSELLKLLKESVSFEGVKAFDSHQIPSLLAVELVNTWSLPLVSLACIALAMPNIDDETINKLFRSVDEGLSYAHIVEKSLNKESEYVNTGRATMTLWHDTQFKSKWLETTSARSSYTGKTPTQIVESFKTAAEKILNEFNTSNSGKPVVKENLPPEVIAANSMHRIARTIESNGLGGITEMELFTRLSCMIGDILAACITNIPRAVALECHESAIERGEASIMNAVHNIGRSSKVLEELKGRELPNMDPDKMGFIDEWRLHLMQP